MKKLLAILLAALMMLSFVACGDDEPETETPLEPEAPIVKEPAVKEPVKSDADIVREYFDENGDEFITSMAESFSNTSNGFTCKGELEVEGTGVTVKILIDNLNDLPDDLKQQMQAAYDEIGTDFGSVLAILQTEVPQLKTMTLKICEEDGDVIATVLID